MEEIKMKTQKKFLSMNEDGQYSISKLMQYNKSSGKREVHNIQLDLKKLEDIKVNDLSMHPKEPRKQKTKHKVSRGRANH